MSAAPVPDHMKWWVEARFGMFIHWGVYAVPSRGEWIKYQENIPDEEYVLLADEFNPKHYHPAEWVEIARDAGMKYMVITTRHHDGFCLYDSAVSDFTAPKTAAGRDLIAEFAHACHAADMPLGFYYSLMDWRFPGAMPHGLDQLADVWEPMVEQAHAQVREILTNYGKVDILWYDGMNPSDTVIWRSAELNAMARELQPGIIINNRAGLEEDYGTPENKVTPESRPWEACYTMNESWGHCATDRAYKTPRELVYLLSSCVAQGGNLLLNVGPDAEGRFPPEAVENLRTLGGWMKRNGGAVYGAGHAAVGAPAVGWATQKGDREYLIVVRWPGSTLPFAWCGSKVTAARVLGTGREAEVEQNGDRVWLHGLPEYAPDPLYTVIELEFDGAPEPSSPPYR